MCADKRKMKKCKQRMQEVALGLASLIYLKIFIKAFVMQVIDVKLETRLLQRGRKSL